MQTQNTNGQLALWSLTSPELPGSISTKVKMNADNTKASSISLVMETRKIVAKRLGLTDNADNRETISAEILKMKDALKMAGIGEIAKLAASDNWTGAAYRITQNKKGDKQKATFTLESVNRTGHKVTRDELVKALAAMNEDEQVEIMEQAEAAARTLGKAIELVDVGDKLTDAKA